MADHDADRTVVDSVVSIRVVERRLEYTCREADFFTMINNLTYRRNNSSSTGAEYFFELACAISGYMLGVNPFDQPGVEAYKNNMYALLGKPGYEEERKALEARIG